MKTILVLTDFSKNAAHAGEMAVWLAEKMHTRLLLWNCSSKIPVAPAYLGGPWLAEKLTEGEDGKHKLEEQAIGLHDFITTSAGGPEYEPQVLTQYAEGSFDEQLDKLLADKKVELMVMGASSSNAIEHLLTGNKILVTIKHANCPVLIIPHKADLLQLNNMVFATNFEKEDINAIQYLANLGKQLDFNLIIVHVTVNGDKNQEMIDKETGFTDQVAKLKNKRISYKEIKGKEVVSGLDHICKQTNAHVLAMTHHQYSVFENLFHNTIRKEVDNQKLPLMIFPEERH